MFAWLYTLLIVGLFARIVWGLIRYYRILRMMKKLPGHPGNVLTDISKLCMESTELRTFAFRSGMGITYVFDKQRFCKIWVGFTPMIFFYKPEEVEIILTNHASMEKGEDYKFLYPWLGRGLITSEGLQWKKSRRILTPAFHFRILEEFIPIMNEQGLILIDKLKEASASHEWVDVIQMVANCTLDVISEKMATFFDWLYLTETAMGMKIETQEGKQAEYVKALQTYV